ncbi:MAG: hypothetical protein A2901_08445 [Elusimicrobia bacterium RIFCSPLOWO2_01_FULL_54_10]|nr:MAG: hypothetical protein A2901_08445 [Elusimicrobia bacterium RIFCSPLOWO2_01_FULL_54_10]
MTRRVVVFCNPDKAEAKRAFKSLSAWLKKKGVGIIPHLSDPLCSSADFAVALGGDGTILAAARALAPHRVPILGVNLGRLGFLAATEFKNLKSMVQSALKGDLKVEERLMLRVSVFGKGGKARFSTLAMNDCYLHAGSSSRIVEVETRLNGEFLTVYKGDGVIVSTPTGSTAYSMAAGGPIVSPGLGVLVVTPISPHTLSQRPLLVSDHGRLDLIVKRSPSSMFFSVDGQVNAKLEQGARVEVRAAEKKLRILVNPKRSYFEILRAKLGWGK